MIAYRYQIQGMKLIQYLVTLYHSASDPPPHPAFKLELSNLVILLVSTVNWRIIRWDEQLFQATFTRYYYFVTE